METDNSEISEKLQNERPDILTLGIPNVCFSLVDDTYDDEQKERYLNQRKQKGYDNSELFNLHCTIAQFIYPRLKDYRDCCADPNEVSGYPSEFSTEVGDGQGYIKWVEILDKMLFSFHATMDESWEDQFYSGEADFYFEPCKDNDRLSELKTGPNHTFALDKEGHNAYSQRIQEGIDLFAKYYQHLWQ